MSVPSMSKEPSLFPFYTWKEERQVSVWIHTNDWVLIWNCILMYQVSTGCISPLCIQINTCIWGTQRFKRKKERKFICRIFKEFHMNYYKYTLISLILCSSQVKQTHSWICTVAEPLNWLFLPLLPDRDPDPGLEPELGLEPVLPLLLYSHSSCRWWNQNTKQSRNCVV